MNSLHKRIGLGVLALAGLILLVPTFLSGATGGYGMMGGGYGGMMGGGYGGGMGLLGPFTQLLFLALLVAGAYVLFQAVAGDGGPRPGRSGDAAIEELRNAYARGDISEEEFERRRATLRLDGER
ncbi:SHOCT domain-containing protein [Halodesulfurarchaeum sp. HSR-GB]|uniref:SHOCT domain-containing protein n=1 Tax=Halodesulfurarchaeum sp. HSR-GB TaxID=3074077 RepID=UPI002861B734|nr:SHOCT domain-containing protein [Halodesulfurarchaeum sp. HSR-GB]MDR5655635.1 SHOCT domain-containing protein [Halodesulfurarchaeum sp. HSR-GB]